MFEALIDFIIRLLGRIMPFMVRWYYKPDKLRKLIDIQVPMDQEGLIFVLSQFPHVSLQLEIKNRLPFLIEIDRLIVYLHVQSRNLQFYFLEKKQIKSFEDVQIKLETELEPTLVEYLRTDRSRAHIKTATLTYYAYFLSNVVNFEIRDNIKANIDYK